MLQGGRIVNSLRASTSGKVLALVIGALLLGAIHFTVIAPLFSYYQTTAQRLEERRELVQRYQSAARDLPRLRAAAAQGQVRPPDSDLLLTGPTDAVAAAALQSILKVLVELEGAKLNSAEMLLPESEDNVIRRVGVRIAFAGNLNLLTTVIEGVETTRPVLSVGSLDIHTAANLDDEGEDHALAIVMDVYGFHSQ
jgi:hypothetical protein